MVEKIDATAKRIEQVFGSEKLAGHDDISRVFPFRFCKQLVEDVAIVIVKLQVDRITVVNAFYEGVEELLLKLVKFVEEQEDIVDQT